VRYRYYHIVLDPSPIFGSTTGFGFYKNEFEWTQSDKWWQLMIVHFGGVYTVNGTPAPFPPRSMLIAPPGARCFLERTTSENITQYWIKFRPSTEGEAVMAVPQIHPMGVEFDHYDEMLRRAIDVMALTRARLCSLAWTLLWNAAENAAEAPEDPALHAAEAFIKENLAAPFELARLADTIGISTSKLHALFKDHRGQSPAEYIRMLRMQLACVLLTKSDRPIKEVAARSGYPNLQSFNKVVRETFGCSPRALRLDKPAFNPITESGQALFQDLAATKATPPRLSTALAKNSRESEKEKPRS